MVSIVAYSWSESIIPKIKAENLSGIVYCPESTLTPVISWYRLVACMKRFYTVQKGSAKTDVGAECAYDIHISLGFSVCLHNTTMIASHFVCSV